VRQPVEQIGLKAAALLDAMIAGESPKKKPVWIAPLEVITRQSTNTLAISDRSVASALTFIRENAKEAIRVSDVAARVGVSRRVLERRFSENLHRSPADYIRRSHLDCAKRLLAETDQPISMVAEASGFPSQQYLTHILRRDSGMSPLKYRRYARAGFR
jgi:LacI family transcriptional regulator